MSFAPDFIFTVPPNFYICDGPHVSFIENCGILRLEPNHFQQLSEIFQSRKAQISWILIMHFPKMQQAGLFEVIVYNVNYPMKR